MLKAPLNPTLNTFRDGASITSLDNFIVKTFIILSNLNLPTFSLKTLSFVLLLQALVRSLSLSFYKHLSGIGRLQWYPPGAFPSPRQTTPILSAVFPSRGVPALRPFLHPSSGPTLNRSMSFLYWEPQSWTVQMLQVGSSWEQSAGQESPPSTCWPALDNWLPGLQVYSAHTTSISKLSSAVLLSIH